MSRYTNLSLVELEAEEAALTAALEAVRGKVRTAEQERAGIIAHIRLVADEVERKAPERDLVDEVHGSIFALRVVADEIERGVHTPPPPSTILEGDA